MEKSSSRLYSGPLSKAAKKIMAALRIQSLQADRHNCSYSNNHRESESGIAICFGYRDVVVNEMGLEESM